MKFITAIVGVISALLITAAMATAAGQPAAPGQNPITCFGSCTQLSKTSARIDTTGTNGGGGVYLVNYNNSFYNVRLSQVAKLQNNVTGDTLGIDPRWSIPIDENGDQVTEAFAFVSFADCNNGAGLVDVINDTTCTVYYKGVAYPNWYTFSHTDGTNYRISFGDYAFIIADLSGAPGVWTVSNVQVGKPGK